MKQESTSQHTNEIAARIWLAVKKHGVSFDSAITEAKANTICPPIAFSDGLALAEEWLSNE